MAVFALVRSGLIGRARGFPVAGATVSGRDRRAGGLAVQSYWHTEYKGRKQGCSVVC